LFNAPKPDPVVEDLRAIDLNQLTPLEAMNRLAELQKRLGRG
jgi:DNA mismatch repair protein MutS